MPRKDKDIAEDVYDPELTPVPVDQDRLSDDLWQELDKLKNPNLKKTGFKPIRKETQVHRKAFLYWMGLADRERTDRAVAIKYEVTGAIVGKWRKSFNWEMRLEYLKRDELKQIQDTAGRSLGEELMTMLSTGALVMNSFHQQVASNAVKLSAHDFVEIGNFMLKLRKELAGSETVDGDAVNRVENILNAAGKDLNQLFVGQLQLYISGQQPLPHDQVIEAEAARTIQNTVEFNEIGEDEAVEEYIDGEFEIDEELIPDECEEDDTLTEDDE